MKGYLKSFIIVNELRKRLFDGTLFKRVSISNCIKMESSYGYCENDSIYTR